MFEWIRRKPRVELSRHNQPDGIPLRIVAKLDEKGLTIVEENSGKPLVFEGVTAAQWHALIDPTTETAKLKLVLDNAKVVLP